MPVLESKLDIRSEVFQTNKSDMIKTLEQLQGLYDEAAQGGGEEAVARIDLLSGGNVGTRIVRLDQ